MTTEGRKTNPGVSGRARHGHTMVFAPTMVVHGPPWYMKGSRAFATTQLTRSCFSDESQGEGSAPSCSFSTWSTTPADAGSSLGVPSRKRALSALTTPAPSGDGLDVVMQVITKSHIVYPDCSVDTRQSILPEVGTFLCYRLSTTTVKISFTKQTGATRTGLDRTALHAVLAIARNDNRPSRGAQDSWGSRGLVLPERARARCPPRNAPSVTSSALARTLRPARVLFLTPCGGVADTRCRITIKVQIQLIY